uniref:Metallo-beta-lactamase n=1 Tax=Fusarium camptoceras TaxID=57143 RepID=A0A109QSY2_9HYPO|nr:metallo-beta-lactamase [Fusarium camptoceras]
METHSPILPEETPAMHISDDNASPKVIPLPVQDPSVPRTSFMDTELPIIPEAPPDLNIPHSQATVKVSIIDTTSYMSNFPMSSFLDPLVAGHEEMKGCDFSFIVEHPKSGNKYDTLLFDLGVRKDWENLPAPFVQGVKEGGCKINVQKDVATILKDNGKDLAEVGGIIWSHWHFDHVGDPQTFPSTTDIIVGPGFKKAHVPAWPTVPDSHIDEKAWQGRTLREISFEVEGGNLKIGQFDALDFYGDGSLYLLNTPGHTIGHLSALARTTADPPTFILMGGDIAHQGGEFRPTPYMPLPTDISPNPFSRMLARPAMTCPGEIFVEIHRNKSRTEPFFDPRPDGSWHHCAHEAKRSIDKLTELDAYENIFPVIAHDNSLYGAVDVYPKPANDWLAKGWKDKTRWGWLNEFDPGSEGLARASEQPSNDGLQYA